MPVTPSHQASKPQAPAQPIATRRHAQRPPWLLLGGLLVLTAGLVMWAAQSLEQEQHWRCHGTDAVWSNAMGTTSSTTDSPKHQVPQTIDLSIEAKQWRLKNHTIPTSSLEQHDGTWSFNTQLGETSISGEFLPKAGILHYQETRHDPAATTPTLETRVGNYQCQPD